MDIKFLKEIGLGKKEFSIYKALLRLGPSSIRKISETASINRGTTHEVLKKLLKKGLARYNLKGKRQHFAAEAPEKLLQICLEKQKLIKSLNKLLAKEIIPDLKNLKFISSKPTAYYYENDEGIEQVLKDVFRHMKQRKNKKYYVLSAQPIRKYLYRIFPNFTKQRIKNKISVKTIALGKGGEQAPLSERKWLQIGPKDSPSSYIIIYGEKLALISLTRDELPYAVVIQEKGIAQTIKLIFQSLWNFI